jgi:hypothetical protein
LVVGIEESWFKEAKVHTLPTENPIGLIGGFRRHHLEYPYLCEGIEEAGHLVRSGAD